MKNLFCALLFVFWGELAFGQPFPEEPTAVLEGHFGIRSLSFSPDGKWLATGGEDLTIRLWDVKALKQVAVLKGHSGWVRSVAFSPDGKWLASGGEDQTVRLWDIVAQKEVAIMHHSIGVNSIAFSPDSNWLASVGINLQLWDVRTHKEVAEIPQVHNASIKTVTFSPNGKLLASGGIDHRIWLWDMTEPKQGVIPKGPIQTSFTVMSIAFSPDSKWLAEGEWGGGKVRIWNIDSWKAGNWNLEALKEVAVFSVPFDSLIQSVVFSPDGKWLAAANEGGHGQHVWLWDMQNQKEAIVLPHPPFGANSVAFSPDGKILASGNFSSVRLWKLDSSAVSVQSQRNLTTTLGEIKRKMMEEKKIP